MDMVVEIKKSEYEKNVCYMTKDIIRKYTIDLNNEYTIKFGRCMMKMQILPLEENRKRTVFLNTKAFEELSLPESLTLNLTVINQVVMIGPVIGVFVNMRLIQNIENQMPPKGAMFITQANEPYYTMIYYFSIGSIDWINKKAEGCYYSRAQRRWIKSVLPLPDVVYDRGVKFNDDEKMVVKHIRRQFRFLGGISVINSRDSLDKFGVCDKLAEKPDVSRYIPETVKFKSIDGLIEMLGKYRTVFLKSLYGSRGSEVMTVSSVAENVFNCTYFGYSLLQKNVEVTSREELEELLKNFFKEKEFTMQQGIDKIQYNGRTMDMRIFIQKNGEGQWKVIYNTVRMGRKGSLITNVARGGRTRTFQKVMPRVLGLSKTQTLEIDLLMREVAVNIAKAIEEEYGYFGELGIDMAIDENLGFWFIEANTKPDKVPKLTVGDYSLNNLVYVNTIMYSKYLATNNVMNLKSI